ncbi:hypothetical protein CCMA1212_010699, partial [Trichoderma ghanense]
FTRLTSPIATELIADNAYGESLWFFCFLRLFCRHVFFMMKFSILFAVSTRVPMSLFLEQMRVNTSLDV